MEGHSKQRSWGAISSHHALTDDAWQALNNVLDAMDGYVYRTNAAEAENKKLQSSITDMQNQMTQVDSARLWAINQKEKIEKEAATYLNATYDERAEADILLNARTRERYEAEKQRQEKLTREREAKQKSKGGWSR